MIKPTSKAGLIATVLALGSVNSLNSAAIVPPRPKMPVKHTVSVGGGKNKQPRRPTGVAKAKRAARKRR